MFQKQIDADFWCDPEVERDAIIGEHINATKPTCLISPSLHRTCPAYGPDMSETSLHAAVANPLSATNTPLHPGEIPPANSTIPTGGGFRIVLPNKVGAWDFRSFTFAPDQIVVNQGDKVTLHFIGVLGVHHIITVDGVGTFALQRGEIHTVSSIANNPGTISFLL